MFSEIAFVINTTDGSEIEYAVLRGILLIGHSIRLQEKLTQRQ